MIVNKIVRSSDMSSPFYFGGDSAYVSKWPKNPEGQDLLLLFTIDCKLAKQQLNRKDLPGEGLIHVFSTYDKTDYFLDSITFDEVKQEKNVSAYTCVIHSEQIDSIRSPGLSIPIQFAGFEEAVIGDDEFCISSLVSSDAPNGAIIPKPFDLNFNFFCQVLSSDFPASFQNALYMADAVGYLLINKNFGNDKADGCFFVQVA